MKQGFIITKERQVNVQCSYKPKERSLELNELLPSRRQRTKTIRVTRIVLALQPGELGVQTHLPPVGGFVRKTLLGSRLELTITTMDDEDCVTHRVSPRDEDGGNSWPRTILLKRREGLEVGQASGCLDRHKISSSVIRMSDYCLTGAAGNVDEFVDIELVSPSAVSGKKMRGSVGCYRSRPKVSATKSPSITKPHEETPVDDPSKWAIVVYKPPPPPTLSFMKPAPQTARKKVPKPCAVREQVPGMRIRGCTPVKRPTPDGDHQKKRKLSHEHIVISDSDDDVQEIVPVRLASAGDRLKSPAVKSPEKRKRQAAGLKGKNLGLDTHEPRYASTDPAAPVRLASAGDRLKSPALKSSEKRKKQAAALKGKNQGPDTHEPRYASTDPAAPVRLASAGDRLKSPAVKSSEKRKKQAAALKGKNQGPDTHEPRYASTDPAARVKEVTTLFDSLRRRYLQEEETQKKSSEKGANLGRPDLRAYNTLKEKNYRVNGVDAILGEVPGVQCGDHFYYRLELYLISLHRPTQAGIDFISASKSTYRDGKGEIVSVAVSVMASGEYEDDRDEGDVLIYTGQGGNNSHKAVKGKGADQELVRGNLALKNSCDLGLPVRVVRKNDVKRSGHPSPSGKIYYYDGLYDVKEYFQEVGASGNKVWKFKLIRREGQGERLSEVVTFKGVTRLPLLLKHRREKVLCEDISNGLEPRKVRVVGGEDDEPPERFEYIVEIKYPEGIRLKPAKTCPCAKECWDRCPCLKWNHGEPPYNENGSLVRGKKAVYECGPQCSCGSECFNRSSQRGIRFNLEVFKTKDKGWGVRSTDYIPPGSFICEYLGEVVHTSEADLRVSTDDYLFDLNVPKSQEKRFGDVSGLVDDVHDDGDEEDDPDCEKWTIDAREYGSVARFINHSCGGNLFAQCVFYEHHDMRFPHIMLFAMEKISPYTELSYDYGDGRRMRL
ncbi:hypothetical protein R1flu_007232 [Riccia fluitans]|uniref:Uncharacterized protein n=1 Tax=Riccia fluitans TaxID=41844 RepID=A0ABD1YZ20_9MARC